MQDNQIDIVVFLIVTTVLILLLASLIITLIYLYQKKQLAYHQNLEKLKLDHEKNLMATQLEIQESTFQHISKEIHDNINLSLTLAKLQLNTLDWHEKDKMVCQVNSSIELISQSIANLSYISKSLNSDIIASQGLITAMETEISKIREVGLLSVRLVMTGNPVFMNSKKELIIFRIMQEAFNNIIRHAKATEAKVLLHYNTTALNMSISDNGTGFILPDYSTINQTGKAGLRNMETRITSINGKMLVTSKIDAGTTLTFYIPYL